MGTRDIIRELCEKNGTTVQRLEKELGFSNGSIAKSDTIKSDRLLAVSKYFGVSMEFLMGETNPDSYYLSKDASELADFLSKNPEYKVLFDASRKVKPEDLKKAITALGLVIDED